MRVAFLTVLILILLVHVGVSPGRASHRPGDEDDGGPATESLRSIDHPVPNSAGGRVRFHLGPRTKATSHLEVRARIRSLPAGVSRIYRLWVVNDFVGDGILIKTFRVDARGNANFSAKKSLRDVWKYRRVVVTLETRRHRRRLDSFTHGPVVLEGVQPLAGD